MPKVWLYACIISGAILLPQAGSADGVNTGLSDPQVIAPTPQVIGPASQSPLSARLGVPAVLPGSNQVGRPGMKPDQIGGYDVNIAYDHVAVGMAIVGVLFLMTEWMENR